MTVIPLCIYRKGRTSSNRRDHSLKIKTCKIKGVKIIRDKKKDKNTSKESENKNKKYFFLSI